ncbi:LOW QUALITY PROTEIN: BTB/POZ domain-containing protein KCTD21-like [Lampetra fluviatilis]
MAEPVTLNVGGTVYTTSLDTLTRFPDSMLAAMFSGKMPTARDAHGRFFIDRDGKIFRHVLNFLRTSRLDLPAGFGETELLRREADFYQIGPLADALRGRSGSPWASEEGGGRGGGLGPGRGNALLHVDTARRALSVHYTVREAPQVYTLVARSLEVFTTNIFCTAPTFFKVLRAHLRVCARVGTGGDDDDEEDGADDDEEEEDDEDDGDEGGGRRVTIDGAASRSDDATAATSSTTATSSSSSSVKSERGSAPPRRYHMRLQWVSPGDTRGLPAREFSRLGLARLRSTAGGGPPRPVDSVRALTEEVMQLALRAGFCLDAAFPEPADLLNSTTLRFVRYC